MARKIKIFLMIFSFGIFIIPKQVFYAQPNEMSCCTKKAESKSCCDKSENSEKPCKENTKQHHCGGDCSSCSSCSLATIIFYVPNVLHTQKNILFSNVKKAKFNYLTPEISDIFSKIWQPPKIS